MLAYMLQLAQLIVNAGGHGALIEYINEAKGNARLPGVMALGYIGAFSETLALAIIVAQGTLLKHIFLRIQWSLVLQVSCL